MLNVLNTNCVPEDHLAPLVGLVTLTQGHTGLDPMPRDEVLQLAATLDAIINQGELQVDAELLDAAPRLKIVANVAIGTNNLDPPLMAKRGVWATNVPDAFTESAADCTLALLLSVARRIAEADRFVRAGRWSLFQPGIWDGMEFVGKVLGIIGYGKIGQSVATRARAFGMQVVFHDLCDKANPEYRELETLLGESDVVSLHVPLVDSTHHLLNALRLASMKPGALLINMARGPVIDEAALVESLRSGHLGGAGLDVFEKEPDVHPDLLEMPNVVLTPHLGGGTRESRQAARLLCAQNVAAVLKGNAPLTPVNRVK